MLILVRQIHEGRQPRVAMGAEVLRLKLALSFSRGSSPGLIDSGDNSASTFKTVTSLITSRRPVLEPIEVQIL